MRPRRNRRIRNGVHMANKRGLFSLCDAPLVRNAQPWTRIEKNVTCAACRAVIEADKQWRNR